MNLRRIVNKVVDEGGEIIQKRIFTRPTIDRMKGEAAEMRRQQIMALRDRRNSEPNYK